MNVFKKRLINTKKDFNLKHEDIRKFLITFLEKFEQINYKREIELNTTEDLKDGLKDITKSVGEEILNFLHQDIDSLDLPEIKKIIKNSEGNC